MKKIRFSSPVLSTMIIGFIVGIISSSKENKVLDIYSEDGKLEEIILYLKTSEIEKVVLMVNERISTSAPPSLR